MVTVNAMSNYSGVSVHTVRYYLRIGLLKPRRHLENKNRVCKASDVGRQRFIRHVQNLGFALGEIFDIPANSERSPSPCQRFRHILQLRIHESKRKIEHLMGVQARMKKTFALWQTHSNGDRDAHSICRLIDSTDEALRPPDYRPTEGTHHV